MSRRLLGQVPSMSMCPTSEYYRPRTLLVNKSLLRYLSLPLEAPTQNRIRPQRLKKPRVGTVGVQAGLSSVLIIDIPAVAATEHRTCAQPMPHPLSQLGAQ